MLDKNKLLFTICVVRLVAKVLLVNVLDGDDGDVSSDLLTSTILEIVS